LNIEAIDDIVRVNEESDPNDFVSLKYILHMVIIPEAI